MQFVLNASKILIDESYIIMNEKSYKMQIVEAAVQGMKDGGMENAEKFIPLLERMFQSGYNEGMREQYLTMLGAQQWNSK